MGRSFRWISRPNKADFVSLDNNNKITKTGKELARLYDFFVKGENIHYRVFTPDAPVECTTIFTHFVKAAKIVIELGALPKDYIRAQFEGLKFARALPFPQQLCTPNARLRYLSFMVKKNARVLKEVHEGDFVIESTENRKLANMAKSLGLKKSQVLRMYENEFSKEFVKQYKRKVLGT